MRQEKLEVKSCANSKPQVADPDKYFAALENQDLGIVKALRKPRVKLDLSPLPGKRLSQEALSCVNLLTNCSLS